MRVAPPLEPVAHLGTTVQAFVGRPASHDAVLRSAADLWGSHVAVSAPSGTVTYSELDGLVDRVAASLRTLTEPGDTVAVALDHDLPLFLVPFVASRTGVTVLLLNTTLSAPAWADQLARGRVELVIADAGNAGKAATAAGLAGETMVMASEAWAMDGPSAGPGAFPSADPAQTLALIATSGTTGVPKMTRVTTSGLIHAAMAYVHLLGLTAEDRSFLCLPLHYIGPLSAQTTTMALVGGRNVIPSDPSPRAAAASMAAAGITYVDAVPAWLGQMVRADAAPVPTWRTLIYGGAPMPPETAARLARRFPDLALWDVWGLSETHGPATAVRYDPEAPPAPGTVGRPLAGVEVRVDGDPGELLVRGANVTPGYADDPDTSRQVLRDGWLRTGDIGTVGPDGTVRLLDRAKDVILRGGANVFSVEVEQVLASHADVREAAVFGAADTLGDEAVFAAVVLRTGADLDVMALRAMVDDAIGRHAVPRRITVVGELPRNARGKIDKMVLRAAVNNPKGNP